MSKNMSDHEKNLVLAVVKYHMSPDLRRKVMTQVPQAYNAWMEHEVVEVHRVSDGNKLDPVVPASRSDFVTRLAKDAEASSEAAARAENDERDAEGDDKPF